MLNRGIIWPSTSPWASPIIVVKKEDGTDRLVVDFRRLNSMTRKDSYPLPRIDDALDAVNGTKYFSYMDQGHPTSIFGKYLFGRQFEI